MGIMTIYFKFLNKKCLAIPKMFSRGIHGPLEDVPRLEISYATIYKFYPIRRISEGISVHSGFLKSGA